MRRHHRHRVLLGILAVLVLGLAPTDVWGQEGIPIEWYDSHQRGADQYEPNQDPGQATVLPLGTDVTDLNFACPPGQSPDCGDVDVFVIQAKGDQCYVLTTRNLDASLDTVVAVFGPGASPDHPLAQNDDAAPGQPASRVEVCLPSGGGTLPLFVQVTNAGRRTPPAPVKGRRYTLRADLALPPTPTPLPAPTAQPPTIVPPTAVPPAPAPVMSVPPPAPVIRVPPPAPVISVPPPTAVPPLSAPPPAPDVPDVPPPLPTAPPSSAPAGDQAAAWVVTRQPDPAAATAALAAPVRVQIAVTVHLRRVSRLPKKASPTDGSAMAGVRVQLVTALGDVVLEAVTPPDGPLILRRDVLEGTALRVVVPALGIDALVPATGSVLITIPDAENGGAS